MSTMLPVATAVAVPFAEQLDRVVLVVAVRVANPIEVKHIGSTSIHIETVEGAEQAHRARDRNLEGLEFHDLPIVADAHAQHRLFALRRDNEPAFGVDGQGDPGTFIRLRVAQPFDFETFEDLQGFRRGGLAPCSGGLSGGNTAEKQANAQADKQNEREACVAHSVRQSDVVS
jgi:hypothetical protein